jgi:hypothetical protein
MGLKRKKRNRLLDFSSLRSNVKSLSPQLVLLSALIMLLVIAYVITRSAEVLSITHTLVVALLLRLGITSLPMNPTN